jgi:L-ascorbate metabolism protein UlaG (beta-lactamase superfamily)
MKLQLIRNATLKIKYAGKVFVIDPFLAPKHTVPSFAGVSPNPTVDLPCAPGEVVDGIEMVIISHLHPDHFDPVAQELLPNDVRMFCQPGDDAVLRQIGFGSAHAIETSTLWEGIKITRTPGRHGTGVWAEQMGNVSGFVFEAPDEPRVYLTGDTIYYDDVKQTLSDFSPGVVVTNSGGAEFPGSGPIIMDAEQTVSLCSECPGAIVVATHLEALDHCTVTREGLRELARSSNIPDERLLIPKDGETLSF